MTDTVMGMLFSGLYVTYFVVVRNSLTMLDCIELAGGQRVLEQAPSMVCGPGTEQESLSRLAWLGLAAIGLGVPVAFLAVLLNFRNKIMRDQQLRAMGEGDTKANPNFAVRQRFKALYQDFRPEMYYWRIIMILRKLIIAIVAMMASEAMFQASVTAFVIFFAFVLQTTASPFLSRQGVPTQLQELSSIGNDEDDEGESGNSHQQHGGVSSSFQGKLVQSQGGSGGIPKSLASVSSGRHASIRGSTLASPLANDGRDDEVTERIVECLAVSALRRHGTPSAVYSAMSCRPAAETMVATPASFDEALSRFSKSVEAKARRAETLAPDQTAAEVEEHPESGLSAAASGAAGENPSVVRQADVLEASNWTASMREMSKSRVLRIRHLVSAEKASMTVERVAAVVVVLETSLEEANIKARSSKKREDVPLTMVRRLCECFIIRRLCCCLRLLRMCKTRAEVREEIARKEGADLVEFAKLATENPALAHIADFNNLESRLLISALLILLIAMVFSTAPFTRGDLLYFGLLILTAGVIAVSGAWFTVGVVYEIYRSLAFAFVYDRSRGLENVLSSLGVKISDAIKIMTDMDRFQKMKAIESANRRQHERGEGKRPFDTSSPLCRGLK